jgi:hypothetical protein
MKYFFIQTLFLFTGFTILGQDVGFPFGKATYRELDMVVYEKDTSASALVLSEYGEAFIDNDGEHNLIFDYHIKIKILKKDGIGYADVEIPLRKSEGRAETVRNIKASAFNKENGQIQETKLLERNIFTVNSNKYYDTKKFAIPNVREGSVIEFYYRLESPFKFNWRTWNFQSDIPKVKSEYVTSIPGNYVYNISLRGFLKLSKDEVELEKDCFTVGSGKADCVRSVYGMKDIPAFVEEDYMTARSNFLSSINYELAEVRYFDGRVDKITKEWKDAELELRQHKEFGIQIKRGKDIVDEHIETLLMGESDPLAKAKKIYTFIKDWYQWNGTYSMLSELGIKKAFDEKKGNIGDINLSLIAAMRYAGLDVEPVILSTRQNGIPVELYPVISDFNYVIAKVNIAAKSYLVDATDDFCPFGLLPERCLNGKGRVLGDDKSYWVDLKPAERSRSISVYTLKLGEDGVIKGTIQVSYSGYGAVRQRKKIFEFNNHQEYIADFDKSTDALEVVGFKIDNDDDIEKTLVETINIEIQHPDEANFLFNPMINGRWKENPFKSKERLYPVDFGAPMEYITVVNFEYPENYEVLNSPENIALSLPNGGGKYLHELQNDGKKLSLNNALVISKTIFPSAEYQHLKELFALMIQAQNGDLIFRKKQ